MKLNFSTFSSLITLPCQQAKWIFSGVMVFFICLVSAAPASAQSSAQGLTISRPLDIFDNVSDKFVVGERAVLKIRNERAKKVVDGGLQARVFTLAGSQSRPERQKVIKGCSVFLSTVLDLTLIDGQHVAFPKMDYRWLGLTDSLNMINPGRYLLVFEKRGATDQQFRLKQEDEDNYFNNGFIFVVSPSKEITVEMVRAAYFERRDKLVELRIKIGDETQKVPCYTYRKLASSMELESDLLQASLDLCEPDKQIKSASFVPLNIPVRSSQENSSAELPQPWQFRF